MGFNPQFRGALEPLIGASLAVLVASSFALLSDFVFYWFSIDFGSQNRSQTYQKSTKNQSTMKVWFRLRFLLLFANLSIEQSNTRTAKSIKNPSGCLAFTIFNRFRAMQNWLQCFSHFGSVLLSKICKSHFPSDANRYACFNHFLVRTFSNFCSMLGAIWKTFVEPLLATKTSGGSKVHAPTASS